MLRYKHTYQYGRCILTVDDRLPPTASCMRPGSHWAETPGAACGGSASLPSAATASLSSGPSGRAKKEERKFGGLSPPTYDPRESAAAPPPSLGAGPAPPPEAAEVPLVVLEWNDACSERARATVKASRPRSEANTYSEATSIPKSGNTFAVQGKQMTRIVLIYPRQACHSRSLRVLRLPLCWWHGCRCQWWQCAVVAAAWCCWRGTKGGTRSKTNTARLIRQRR